MTIATVTTAQIRALRSDANRARDARVIANAAAQAEVARGDLVYVDEAEADDLDVQEGDLVCRECAAEVAS